MNNVTPRSLGAALLVGALMLAIVIVWLAATYVQGGQAGVATAVLAAAVALLLLVLPQVALAIYLLRQDGRADKG